MTAAMEGFPERFHDRNSHTNVHVAAPICDVKRAFPATPLAANALPALNPNHPSHSIVAPITASGKLWGTIICGP